MTYLPDIPTLTTDRLILRAPCASDFGAYAEFWAGPRATPFGGPFSRTEAWNSFLSDAGHWAIKGFGQWTIALKETDQPVGWTGFVQEDGAAEPELGWTVYDSFEGKGLTAEATRAARTEGAARFSILRPISRIADWNKRSIALAERLGATLESESDNPTHGRELVYRHPSKQALTSQKETLT